MAFGGGLSTVFGRAGPTVRAGGATLALRVTGIGYGGSVATPASSGVGVSRDVVSYRHGSVVEWYRNGPLGLQQGSTLRSRPRPRRGWLTVSERVSGGLTARRAGSSCLLFAARASGPSVLRYCGLSATDARGRVLPARLVLRGATVLLRVDDSHASYPVTIDPLIQEGAKLTADDETGDGEFGFSAALSSDGDTALIGGPYDNNIVGAAWVFTRSGSTWTVD